MLFGKFKPKMLDKWLAQPPKSAKLLKLRQNMTAEELTQTADFAWEQDWPQNWLSELPDPSAEALLVDCWADGTPDKQKAVLSRAIAMLKTPTTATTAKNLLTRLDDDYMLNLLLPTALSHSEAAAESYPAELLAELLVSRKEQTGRLLLMIFPDLSEPGKLLAIELCGLLMPTNAADLLHHALLDPWENVRVLAAKTAGILQPEILVSFLAPALRDRCDTVRTAACETLGKYAGADAIPTLRKIKEADRSWTVKSMCTQFVTRWENALAEQIRLDEGELFLQDAEGAADAEN